MLNYRIYFLNGMTLVCKVDRAIRLASELLFNPVVRIERVQ